MDRKTFDTLKTIEQIQYINKELSKGNTLTSICKNIIGIGRSTIRDRAAKINYKYDKNSNKYLCHKNNIKMTNNNIVTNNQSLKKINTAIDEIAAEYTKDISECHKDVIELPKQYYENVIKIAERADILITIIEEYQCHKNVIDMSLLNISQLSQYSEKIKNRSFNVNSKILDMFSKFCKEHKNFKQQDLISLALLEFVKKYK